MTKSQAFRQIAADTDKTSGTVAAAYSRVARSKNRSPKPRPGSAKQAVTPRARRQGASQRVVRGRTAGTGQGVDHIVGRLVANLQALTEAVKAQNADVKELRSRLDGMHSLLNN